MDATNNRINFFKNKIKDRLEELRPYMSDIKYRLYKTMIEKCSSLDEIREMAELDMQFSLIKYLKELEDKLKSRDISLDELEALANRAPKTQLSIITPKKKEKKVDLQDIDVTELGDALEDEDVLASMASLLMSRINTEPIEQSNVDEGDEDDLSDTIDNLGDAFEEDKDFDLSEEDEEDYDGTDEDEFDLDEIYGDSEIEDAERLTDDSEDEFDLSEMYEDSEDIDEDDEESDEYDLSDFEDDYFKDDDTEDDEESDGLDIDSLTDDDLFEEDDDFEDEDDEPDDELDIDSLTDDDLFEEDADEDEEDDIESEELDLDSLTDDDLFEDDDDFDDDTEDDNSDTLDIDNMPDDDIFDDDDEYDEDSEDEDEDSDSGNRDPFSSLDMDDIFSDDEDPDDDMGDESESDESDSGLELDLGDIFGDDDELDTDIDESDLKPSTPKKDDFDDFFNTRVNATSNSNNQAVTIPRNKSTDKIFINGTARGNQTQKMFNFLVGMIDRTESIFSKKNKRTNRRK